ncbi:MAG: hypothetical protein EP343_09205 [Deltaproteobacteria bacterium]|nr:MAG: hypothetical protein EP343_09205 [Deltaproteobacteria bacterium]
MSDTTKQQPMIWVMIFGLMLLTGLVAGLALGTLSTFFPLSKTVTTSGVGAAIGVVGALLMARRGAALKQQEK